MNTILSKLMHWSSFPQSKQTIKARKSETSSCNSHLTYISTSRSKSMHVLDIDCRKCGKYPHCGPTWCELRKEEPQQLIACAKMHVKKQQKNKKKSSWLFIYFCFSPDFVCGKRCLACDSNVPHNGSDRHSKNISKLPNNLWAYVKITSNVIGVA